VLWDLAADINVLQWTFSLLQVSKQLDHTANTSLWVGESEHVQGSENRVVGYGCSIPGKGVVISFFINSLRTAVCPGHLSVLWLVGYLSRG
jgi:hypothetical protein